MKKMVKRIAAVMLALVLVLALSGCAKETTVTFRVEGIGHCSVFPSKGVKSCCEDAASGGAFTAVLVGDGDFALDVREDNGQKHPITLKLHNGQVETEASEGVTVTVDSVK